MWRWRWRQCCSGKVWMVIAGPTRWRAGRGGRAWPRYVLRKSLLFAEVGEGKRRGREEDLVSPPLLPLVDRAGTAVYGRITSFPKLLAPVRSGIHLYMCVYMYA